jgi:hypothetical protein
MRKYTFSLELTERIALVERPANSNGRYSLFRLDQGAKLARGVGYRGNKTQF